MPAPRSPRAESLPHRTDTTFAAAPPSSTYRGPKIAGSEGGFIGLVTGLGIVVILAGLGFWLFHRRRQNNRRRDAEYAGSGARGTTGGSTSTRGQGQGWGRAADEDDDAFEMPPSFGTAGLQSSTTDFTEGSSAGERKQWLNPSTMSLDYRQGAYAGSTESVATEDNPFSDAVEQQSDGREARGEAHDGKNGH